MIKFDGRIVQFGFGAVGKSFYEKVKKEIKFNEYEYYVITRYPEEFEAYVDLGGIVANFSLQEITKANFREIFDHYLNEGDLLLDFADTVGTKDFCDWCAEKNIMYLNTNDADWPENWLNIFEQSKNINEIRVKHNSNAATNKHPIVIQHGNNPGLVSHFVKKGIEYIIHTQFKKNKKLQELCKQHRFNEIALELGIRLIQVNDIDTQKISGLFGENTLVNTWSIDSFLFEMLTEATLNLGTHETVDYEDECKLIDRAQGYLEFDKLAVEKKGRTYYPQGAFEGFLIPHDETVSIAKSLEIIEDGRVAYRPSVMFLYQPCHFAERYFENAKVNDYPNPDLDKPLDCENIDGDTIIHGYQYPKFAEIVYREKIQSGTEYVGVLILGEEFEPVWVGNRIPLEFLYKNKKSSYWQTPTITPVAMSALAAVSWMIKNKDKGGIYYPDDIEDYDYILRIAEKYITKTIYQTFNKKELERELGIDFSNLQIKDFLIK